MVSVDATAALQDRIVEARAASTPLRIVGGGTRGAWLPTDAACRGAVELPVSGHRGVVAFEPSELVVTARCGTTLEELEALLAGSGQCLPFDPPRFGPGATLGGALASGLSGPARPFHGAARDAVLGVRLLDGRGEIGRFGGEVMKNVAGYDVARLVTGAWGTLGVVLEASLRLRCLPEREETRVLELGLAKALERMTRLQRAPLPLTGLAWIEGLLHVRLAGTDAGVTTAAEGLGGDPVDGADAQAFWTGLRDLTLPFFASEGPLWRLSLPADAPQPKLPANWLLDWGGAQRWCTTDAAAERVDAVARAAGGHATRIRPDLRRMPQPPGLARLQRRVLSALDPDGLLNAGALYPQPPAGAS